MTEQEWNTAPIAELLLYTLEIHRARYGAEPENSFMLQEPRSALTVDRGRKHALLAYGVLRRYWHSLSSEIKQAVETLEALEDTPGMHLDPPLDDFNYIMDLFLAPMYQGTAGDERSMAMWVVGGWWPDFKSTWADKKLPESWRSLIHDVFGDFFRPAAINPAWLAWNDTTAQKIAQAIYDERAFDLMPILADALEEAGCTDANILHHCRQPAEHVRGCWVIDLVLGKA
jgi:hypothetical protein